MQKWYVGSDHAGYKLKKYLVSRLREMGDDVVDLGTESDESVDYPDYGAKVGRRVSASEGKAMGLLVCGTGIGVAITANKIPGVRAAVVTDAFTAQASRAHNDANVMAVGARVVGPGVAESALRVFRETKFEGGRHERRVAKISALETGRKPDKARAAKADTGDEADDGAKPSHERRAERRAAAAAKAVAKAAENETGGEDASGGEPSGG